MSKQPPSHIDPTELMAFLACYDEYPTSGYHMSQAAREQDRSDRLVHFLEHLPGEIESEQAVSAFAAEESGLEVPMDQVRTASDEPAELDIQTVKDMKGD